MPKKDIYFPSEPIEAECRVTGMPVPQVEWVHGSSGALTVSQSNQTSRDEKLL